ncbi:MAG: S-layer homology domain-containing protein [Clostridiales bacterium]|jgi:hypothetical protein|nr:S-layer homology domain-containing protein [Clostridiales bacterium]
MKRFFALGLAMVSLFCLACGGIPTGDGNLQRRQAAVIVADALGLADGDVLPVDVSASDGSADKIKAVASRDIFGKAGLNYEFRPDAKLTRYELAKVAVCALAALECVADENLAPGAKRTVTDVATMQPEQQWYIYAALDRGFVTLGEGNKYDPQGFVTEAVLQDAISKVKAYARSAARGLAEYRAEKLNNFKSFPVTDAALAEKLTIYKPNQNQRGTNLAAATLQGLLNREEIRLYIDYGGYAWMTDYAAAKGYVKSFAPEITSFDMLLARYNDSIERVVVYDTDKLFTVNAAMDIAAVEGRVLADEQVLEKILAYNPYVDVLDLRDFDFDSQYEAQEWSYRNNFPFLRRDAIAWAFYGTAQSDWARDYHIQMKLPNLWIPGNQSPDYDTNASGQVGIILSRFPVNIPVLGFQAASDGETQMGIGEFPGVQLCGEYGKYTAVFDSVGNLSFHTGIKVAAEKLRFTPKAQAAITFDSAKKYVAVTMQESGDAPCYIEYGFKSNQWDNVYRGEIPYNYSYGLNNIDLLPLLTQYWFETARTGDYFYGSISGLGYNYPLGGFGSKGAVTEDGQYMDQDLLMLDHYIKANELAGRLGFESMGIYSYPDGVWNKYDYEDFDRRIASVMTNIKTFMADMHRPPSVSLTKERLVVETGFGQRIYHCSTFWGYNTASYGNPNDTANDGLAVSYLVNEIRQNTVNGGNFYQCMAYSWSYGPRRVKMVIDRLNELYPNEYVFVTVDRLDALYRSQK